MKRIVVNREYVLGEETVKVLHRTKKWITYGLPNGEVRWGYLKPSGKMETATFEGTTLFTAADTVKAKGNAPEVYTIVETTSYGAENEYEGSYEGLLKEFSKILNKVDGCGIIKQPRTAEALVLNLNKAARLANPTYHESYRLEQGIG
jgi:hypothetical protein